ncbi:unnamed protein product [Meganyctiphanes norvegica]|uniref:Uncharacterized protein n=1 Tax=Meganyctiphanes norvegica TaxID=48144 RepID=A0AAV2Q5E2_MEGNR
MIVRISAAMIMFLVLGAKLPAPTLSQGLEHGLNDFCHIFVEPRLVLCHGTCKPRCGWDETVGHGYCGSRCYCCKPKIINTCFGKCRTHWGYGYCKETCEYGEERFGRCLGGSCSCCKYRPTCHRGPCRTRRGYGYCKETCGFGEELLGGCKGGNGCSCCRNRPIERPVCGALDCNNGNSKCCSRYGPCLGEPLPWCSCPGEGCMTK